MAALVLQGVDQLLRRHRLTTLAAEALREFICRGLEVVNKPAGPQDKQQPAPCGVACELPSSRCNRCCKAECRRQISSAFCIIPLQEFAFCLPLSAGTLLQPWEPAWSALAGCPWWGWHSWPPLCCSW